VRCNLPRIIVFDVNETLLDVSSLAPVFKAIYGDSGALREWLSLLLLHSEVAALAGPYFDFSTLARPALKMVAESREMGLAPSDEDEILHGMLSLPAHREAPEGLEKLRRAGLTLVTLTNSTQRAVEQQLATAGLSGFFERNFSVELKPSTCLPRNSKCQSMIFAWSRRTPGIL